MAKANADPRPLSPHVGIWRWTITMAGSITHRATGVALYAGTLILAWWLISAAAGPAAFERASALLGSPLGVVVLAGYAWALSFHLLNGVRHLFWDVGHGFAPRTATMTAWAVYAGSLVVAAVVMVVALG